MPVDRANPMIRNLRKGKGWTQSQLAREADVSLRTVQFAESGRGTLKPQTLLQIAEALECELDDLTHDESIHRQDAFQKIPWTISAMLRRRIRLSSDATCTKASEVETLVRRMRSEWKEHLALASGGAKDAAYLRSDRLFDQDLDRYVERYRHLWFHLPETIQVATDGNRVFGLSIVLPLRKEAFDAFVRGDLPFMEIDGRHLQAGSQNLLLDSVCEFSHDGAPGWNQLTSSLSFTMISQIARFAENPVRDDFQMASIAASELNATRLRENGFRINGITTPGIDCPVLVFSQASDQEFCEQYVQASNMSHIARLTRQSWKSRFARRVRQGSLRWTLKAVKWGQALDEVELSIDPATRRATSSEIGVAAVA